MVGSGSWRSLAQAIALPTVVLCGVGVQSSVDVSVLTVDPASQADLPPWTGALSTAGILLWCIGATSGIAAGSIRGARSRDANAACAFAFGLLAAWLCADDAFLVHDALGPRYLGVPELAIIGGEALWLCALLVRHRAVLLAHDTALFGAAMVCFAASVVGDASPTDSDVPGLWRLSTYIVEDGFKWLGICAYTTWLVRLSRRVLTPIEA